MSCEHDCLQPPAFPEVIFNRPALETIAYRIGMYSEMRACMLDRIDKRPELAGWTHRQADDPGIALLEAGAIVADILTFYQDVYANEAFLRTAKWQESVFDLVRLLGYRPAPGIGGTATFAITVKGEAPVVVPGGFGFKVKLEGMDQQAEFESTEEAAAYPHLGDFRLYRPRLSAANITPITAGNRLELAAVDGSGLLADISSVVLNPGDRVMLVPTSSMYDVQGAAYSTQAKPEILIVKEAATILDRVVITFEGAITQSRGTLVEAYVIDRTFRHFGHDAPPLTTTLTGDPPEASFVSTRFLRDVWGDDNPTAAESSYYSAIDVLDMPLDQEVDDLATGGSLICEGTITFDGQSLPVPITVARTVNEVRPDALSWGNKTGSTSVVVLDKRLVPNDNILNEAADIRRLRFHEAVSPRLTFRAPTQWTSGVFNDTKLNFFGTLEQAEVVKGRSLLLVSSDGRYQDVNVQADLPSLSGGDPGPRIWEIELDRPPEFIREDFDEASPRVTVYGNLVEATQGKTQPESAIGSGDTRLQFQTMPLAKSPLTWLLDAAATPPEQPELTVWVERVEWQRAETFFGAGPSDNVYIVRQDDKGASQVQFGDGEMGSRLPSGSNNVVATYRTGTGASGLAQAGEEPKASGRLAGLDKVILPKPAVGGAEPETEAISRVAAPGRMQSLGRLVSLPDYEAEALAIPGVIKTRAWWVAPGGVPLILLVVLTESGSEADIENVRETMATYNRCKGPSRYSIGVARGLRQYVHVALTVGHDPARRPEDIAIAVKLALGVGGEEGNGLDGSDGLFGLASRRFGETAHVSQILGRAQQADGVRWVLADAAQLIPLGNPPVTDPAQLPIPGTRVVQNTLPCLPGSVLALQSVHLELNLVADEGPGACE